MFAGSQFRETNDLTVNIMLVPDLAALVCDYASDSTLLKLSMVSKTMLAMLTNDAHHLPKVRKYSVRLHKHRYNVASAKLERLHRKMKSGQIVDLDAIAKEQTKV